jgi:hypothetical protein
VLAKDRDPQNSFYNDLKEGGQSVEGQRLQLPAARTPSNDSKTCVLAMWPSHVAGRPAARQLVQGFSNICLMSGKSGDGRGVRRRAPVIVRPRATRRTRTCCRCATTPARSTRPLATLSCEVLHTRSPPLGSPWARPRPVFGHLTKTRKCQMDAAGRDGRQTAPTALRLKIVLGNAANEAVAGKQRRGGAGGGPGGHRTNLFRERGFWRL